MPALDLKVPELDVAEIATDPHGIFARLRPATPVIRLSNGAWMALRFRDVIPLMTDPRTRQVDGAVLVEKRGVPEGRVADFLRNVMLLSNDPEHRRRRGPFARTFSHAALRALRPLVRARAARLVADLPRGVPFDFLDRMATRLPAGVICAILGIPEADVPRFTGFVQAMSPCLSAVFPIEIFPQMEAGAEGLLGYVRDLVVERQARPGDDLVSQVLREAGPDRVEEVICQLMALILAGSDTTRGGLAMTLTLLLEHAAQWQALCADPALAEGAVLEGLRFDPPVGSLPRLTVAPIGIDGIDIPPMQIVTLGLLSALRDPSQYADPDRFDIRRTDHPRLHPVFGGGPHRCLGEVLARIEMEEALVALATSAPALTLLERPRMRGFGGIRQISAMTVQID